MSFLNPLFLLGLAAVAAPILVHLVRRTRARRVEFPALVFVRQIPQRTIRRRTLHNLLLLLLRCLAVLLVVFAFTRPFFSGAGASAETETTRATVFLIDSSLSMRHADHFSEAVRRADTILGELPEDERVALVRFGEGYEVLSEFTAEKHRVRAALAGLGAGFEGTDYEQALRGAESLFTDLRAGGAKRVFLISDFQAAGWQAARATFRLRDDIRLALIDVGGKETTPNVAVTNVEARGVVYGQKYVDKVAVHLSNFGDVARERVGVDLQVNDQTVEKREISLAARDSRVVEFTGFNLGEGPNRCAVRLRADDFEHDNQFYFTLRGETPAKAVIIDSAARGLGDSFYLQSALSAGEGLPFAFSVKSAGALDPADVAGYSLVVLNDAGNISGALAEAVVKFVESGGPVIVATGPNTRAESFNRALERVAPVRLTDAVQLQRGESAAVTDVKTAHPVFEIFRGGATLSSARVFGYHRSEPRERAVVLARFEDGSPALVESSAGAAGRVLLFTSTLGMNWNDLPLTPLYLPLVQQMVRYLGEREAVAWHRLGQTFTVARASGGEPPAIDTPSEERLKTGTRTPDGDLLVTGREPGFYRLRYEGRPDFAAVNVDGREGDFAKLNTDEFLAGVTGGDAGASAEAEADADARVSGAEIEARQRVWWPLLVAALLLFAAEAVLARRTKMVRMIG
ncbi:MAG TPA: BatA domain-containing protein [Pyrinomonadaceae bacterium]